MRDTLAAVHERAMRRFDAVAVPQKPIRELMRLARRFVVVPGGQWEDSAYEDLAQNMPRPEIDMVTKTTEKIEEDYRENRLTVSFLPGEDADDDTAETLNGMFRSDAHTSKASQAWDNAFSEGIKGGMGAWRLITDYVDPYDPDKDHQRILPGVMIPEADQSVYFYGGTLYDGSDAKAAFVISATLREEAEDEWGADNISDWPLVNWRWQWDWYTPDVVYTAEYYEVEDKDDTLYVFTQKQSGEERRYFKSELDDDERADLVKQGWKLKQRPIKRRRIHKYIMNGTKVLKDDGFIAGDNIPLVPFYGRVDWMDNQPVMRGYVQKKMDPQRILNTQAGKLVEISALAPYQVPIVADEQMTPRIAEEWARGNIDRHPFRRLLPLRNTAGEIVTAGPIGSIEPPQIPPPTVELLQFAVQMLGVDDDGAQEVKSNTSADAMDIAAQRVDSKSGIYLDNMAQSLARCGEIYRGMARDIYFEAERKVDTRSLDGKPGSATLQEPVIDADETYKMRNDLTRGTYHVEASVQESTATKRQKAMRQGLELGQAFMTAGSSQDALAAFYTAAENMDGEGIGDLIAYYRQRSVAMGATKPTPEEAKQIAAAQANQQPDPAAIALTQEAAKKASEAKLNEAKAVQTLADAHLKSAQAETLDKAPKVPSALSNAPTDPAMANVTALADAHAKVAGAALDTAKAAHLHADMAVKRIKTGAELHQQAHDQHMAERQQDHAEKQADKPQEAA